MLTVKRRIIHIVAQIPVSYTHLDVYKRQIELLAKMNGNEGTKDNLDKKEQKERIKAQQLENQKKAQALEGNVVSEDIMSDYFDKLEGVVKDGS